MCKVSRIYESWTDPNRETPLIEKYRAEYPDIFKAVWNAEDDEWDISVEGADCRTVLMVMFDYYQDAWLLT